MASHFEEIVDILRTVNREAAASAVPDADPRAAAVKACDDWLKEYNAAQARTLAALQGLRAALDELKAACAAKEPS